MDDLFESKQPPKKRRKLTKNYEISSEVKEVAKPKKEKKERCDEDSLEEGDYIEDSQGTIEQEGGSSQDKMESDFIDDGCDEQKEAKQLQREQQGHIEDSDEEKGVNFDKTEDVDKSSNDEDPYDSLELAED